MKDLIATQSVVALVEDDQDFLDMVAEAIKPYFSEVLKATTHQMLKDMMRVRSVNVVVSDLKMPCGDGLELAKYLREHYPMVPVIILSGQADAGIVEKAFDQGVYDFLEKPVRPRILVNRIQNTLLFPQLVQVSWAIMSKQLAPPQIEDFLRMPLNEQLKTIHAFSALVKTRSLHKPLRGDGAA